MSIVESEVEKPAAQGAAMEITDKLSAFRTCSGNENSLFRPLNAGGADIVS